MISARTRPRLGRCVAGGTLVAVLAGGIPVAARAEAPDVPTAEDPAESTGKAPATSADGRRTLGRLPENLGRTAVGVFNKDNLVPFLAGSTLTGGAAFLDDNVRDAASNPESGFGKTLEAVDPWPVAAVVTGLFVGGRLAHGARFRATTYDLANGVIVNLVYTELLKVTVRRERPDGTNNQSFPSGHTSDAFTWATVFERHYGWKWGVPAYALAATMGYSRIVRDKHYLSDVVAGATLGYIVGRTVVRVNDKPLGPPGGATLNVSPIVGPRARGLQASLQF